MVGQIPLRKGGVIGYEPQMVELQMSEIRNETCLRKSHRNEKEKLGAIYSGIQS